MRIPKNKILENQYTTGNEFIRVIDSSFYVGYYCIIGGTQYFTGKTYDKFSYRLERAEDTISTNSLNIKNTGIYSIQWIATEQDAIQGYSLRYFIKKKTSKPILIKEVNKDTYDNVDSAIWEKEEIIWFLNVDNNLEFEMVGLKEFLS